MNLMKRISGLVCICLLCSVNVLGASAKFVNYCDIFESSTFEYINFRNQIDESECTGIELVKGRMSYTASHIPNRDNYTSDYDHYSFPADVFEKWATTFFDINIDEMRSVSNQSDRVHYDTTKNTYDYIMGAWGGAPGYMIYGYTDNNNGTYSVYMKRIDWFIEPCSSLEEFYEKTEDFEERVNRGSYTGEVVFINGLSYDSKIKGYFPVEGYYIVDVKFDGNNVKYLKSVEIESIPDIENIIKPDTEAIPEKPIDNIVEYKVPDSISISDNKCFSNGTIVKAESINAGDLYEQVKNIMRNIAEKFYANDFSATKDGQLVQPNGKVKVTFSIPDEYSDNCSLYYIDMNGTVNKLNSTFDKESRALTAELELFGIYVVADEDTKPVEESQPVIDNTDSIITGTDDTNVTTNSPQTGDNSPLYLFFIVISVSGIMLCVMSKRYILKQRG